MKLPNYSDIPRTNRSEAIRHSGPGLLMKSRVAVAHACVSVCLLSLNVGKMTAQQPPVSQTSPGSVTVRSASSARTYMPASIHALPGLQCTLRPAVGAPTSGITVFTDNDGYARFHAVKPADGEPVQPMTLDCKDPMAKASTYGVDLTSADIFVARPVNLAKEVGIDRPALKGDPLQYSQSQLIQTGYGLRPDRAKDAGAYARWLTSASKPGRFLQAKRPSMHSHNVTSTPGGSWAGSVLTGAPVYVSAEAIFNVPTAIPGGDGTTSTEIAIWNGLGGYNTGSGLIQGGVSIQTTPNAAGYGSWREYCCGDPNSNGYGGAFTPNPGDQIYSEEWYCDAKGNLNVNGGYGCTFLHNLTSGAILSCTLANGSPCWSVPALPLCSVNPTAANCMTLGQMAEFIIENQSPQISTTSTAFTDFNPQVKMAGSAYSSTTARYSQAISTDSAVLLLTDSTNTTTKLSVSLGTNDETYFDIFPKPFMLLHDWQTSANAGWAGSASLGGYATQVEPARNQDGRLEIFYIGTDSAIYHNWQIALGSGWNGETALGGSALQLAIGQNSDGRLEVFYVGKNNAIYHNWQIAPNGGWAGEHAFGGYAKQVAVAKNADGRLEVFYIGTNDGLYHNWQKTPGGVWAGENAFSGDSAKQITVASNANGCLELFYVGTNDDLYHNWQITPGAGWAGETHFSGDSAKQVVAARNVDGRLEIFYIGTNDDLYHNWQTSPSGNWFGETRFAQNSARQLAVAANANGRLEIFYVGTDSNIYHNWQNTPGGNWYGETRLDTQAKQVAAIANADGRLELFYINN